LLGFHLLKLWTNTAAAPFFVIQQGGNDTRGIESRETHEINGTVKTDQGNRIEIANYAKVLDGLIAHAVYYSVGQKPFRKLGNNFV
jgi:hypothetical protein